MIRLFFYSDPFEAYFPDSTAKLLFEYSAQFDGKESRLYLSNIQAALPGSQVLRDKRIKAVISIIQPDELDPSFKAMAQLYAPTNADETIYQEGLDTIVLSKDHGVLFYNVYMADISNPQILTKPKPPLPAVTANDLFLRIVWFIRHWLSKGDNVLVHCEKGQRRSPTMILAFLISQGLRTHQALELLGSNYVGDSTWADGYKKSRQMWIAKLQEFESTATHQLAAFALTLPKLAHALQGFKWTTEEQMRVDALLKQKIATPSNPEVSSKKRPSTQSTEKSAPPTKKFKLAPKTTMPASWANRKK